MNKIPQIGIIGQPNVGKSTLLNALLKRRAAIVDPKAGTTLDLNSAFLNYKGYLIELVDSGGVGMDKNTAFAKEVQHLIQTVLKRADAFLLITDIRNGVTPLDKEIAQMVRATGKKVILAVNKADTRILEANKNEFFSLGLGEPVPVSALQKRGVDTLRDEIIDTVKKLGFTPPEDLIQALPLRLAIVGKRNVGKSTLVNSLAQEEKVIVSEIPGTTRDSIDVRFELDGEIFIAVDTAGLRRKRKPKDTIEIYSRLRTESAIERADVVFFMIDALENLSEVDKKIAEYLIKVGKPSIILINKWDLVKGKMTTDDYIKYLSKILPNLDFAPIAFISAKTGFNIWENVRLSKELYKQSNTKLPTSVINKALKRVREAQSPSSTSSGIPRIYYATQTNTNPPEITMFVNNPALFSASYQKFVVNRLRHELSFSEIPLRLNLRKRQREKD